MVAQAGRPRKPLPPVLYPGKGLAHRRVGGAVATATPAETRKMGVELTAGVTDP